MLDTADILSAIAKGNYASLAKAITMVETKSETGIALLNKLDTTKNCAVVGVTGAPGAGKSTLINCLIKQFTSEAKRVAVLSVDPSSPFNYGALLGDRIRMAEFYLHPQVYIRSLASRGALGGLHPNIIEIVELVKAANFDYIIIETVGVGQSEVDIAGLADTTIVLVVPEGGDEVQTMKAGVMEIADIFVVNKCDRPQANAFVKNLNQMVHQRSAATWNVPVLKCVASKDEGITELMEQIILHANYKENNLERKSLMYANRLMQLLVQNKMQTIDKAKILLEVKKAIESNTFNLFGMVEAYSN